MVCPHKLLKHAAFQTDNIEFKTYSIVIFNHFPFSVVGELRGQMKLQFSFPQMSINLHKGIYINLIHPLYCCAIAANNCGTLQLNPLLVTRREDMKHFPQCIACQEYFVKVVMSCGTTVMKHTLIKIINPNVIFQAHFITIAPHDHLYKISLGSNALWEVLSAFSQLPEHFLRYRPINIYHKSIQKTKKLF